MKTARPGERTPGRAAFPAPIAGKMHILSDITNIYREAPCRRDREKFDEVPRIFWEDLRWLWEMTKSGREKARRIL